MKDLVSHHNQSDLLGNQSQPTVENTTLEQRANQLETYLDLLPCEPLLMPLEGDSKEPLIKVEGISLDTADHLLVTGPEAVDQLRNGDTSGFCIYAGRESHNTHNLVFTDHDDPDRFHPDSLPETLLAQSGSGTGFHQTYINASEVSNSLGTGDLDGAGEIRADNWYIVTPGSAHPSGGIYHLLNQHPPTELATEDLPSELQPSTHDSQNLDDRPVTNSEVDQISDQIDNEAVEIAQTHLNEFKSHSPASFNCVIDRLNGGRGSFQSKLSREDEPAKIDRDLQEKTTLTHLYGIFRQAGKSQSRAQELAFDTLSYYCINSNNQYNKDGEPRKWLKRNETYRNNQLTHAVEQFDQAQFRRFCNQSSELKTERKLRNHEYSDPTQGLAHFIVYYSSNYFQAHNIEKDPHTILVDTFGYTLEREEFQVLSQARNTAPHMYNDTPVPSGVDDTDSERLYPTKTGVSRLCAQVDSAYKGLSQSSFDRCLSNLQARGWLCVAQLEEGIDYRIYPETYPDPPQADWVRTGGERLEPNMRDCQPACEPQI